MLCLLFPNSEDNQQVSLMMSNIFFFRQMFILTISEEVTKKKNSWNVSEIEYGLFTSKTWLETTIHSYGSLLSLMSHNQCS